jgi:hypothetical protein
MNPVVLIATHNRIAITEANIRSLYAQKQAMPTVVLVCSTHTDYEYFRNKFVNLHVLQSPNEPLGNKWQTGVEYCRTLKADPLIILGSDDLLSSNAVQLSSEMCKYYDFIGFAMWSVYDITNKAHYIMRYNSNVVYKNFTLGAGRFYSKRLLDRFNWKLFNTSLDRNLDNLGHENTFKHSETPYLIRNFATFYPWVMSVKGTWSCLNDTTKLLRSDNLDIQRGHSKQEIIEGLFPKDLFKHQ